MSPLLFALATEPLACAIWQLHSRRGLPFSPRNIVISLYADGITLYLQTPGENLDLIIHKFSRYKLVTGITINWYKTAIFALTPATKKVKLSFLIQWVDQPFKYLSIWLSPNKAVIITSNYGTSLMQLEEKVDRWLKLPLTLIGRCPL